MSMGPTLNRVKQATTSTGTGTVNLDGSASSSFQTWAASGAISGVVYPYLIEDGANWELGTGTYTSGSPATFSRTLRKSSSGALLNLSGSAIVSCVEAAPDVAEAYYAGSDTSVSTGTMPTAATALDSMTITVPASDVARKFAVSAMCCYSGSHHMRGTVTLDGTLVFPTLVTAGFDPIATVGGVDWLGCSGVIVTVPGDSASHTITLAGQPDNSTAALTLNNRTIVAIKVG